MATALPRRLFRACSAAAQLAFVVLLIEWLVFSPGLLRRLVSVDPAVTSQPSCGRTGSSG